MECGQETGVSRMVWVLLPLAMSSVLFGMSPDSSSLTKSQIDKIAAAIPKEAIGKPLKHRCVLVYSKTEGFYHQSIVAGNYALWLMGKATGAYECEFVEDKSVFSKETLERFDAIVFNNPCKVEFAEVSQQKAILDFVAHGKGFVGIHCAVDCFQNWAQGAQMLGGLFRSHPWGAEGTWGIKIDEPNHPLVQSFNGQGFYIQDEIYQMSESPYSREKLRVLLSLDMTKPVNKNVEGAIRTDQDIAISWIRTYEQGRVFFCSFGHNDDVFWQPRILDHYLAGIQFALGDLLVDSRPSAALATKPKAALAPDK